MINRSNIESLPQLPRKQRAIITLLFVLITLYLSSLVINKVTTEVIVLFDKEEIQATIDQKITTRGKTGISYFYTYSFMINNNQYKRPLFLGLSSSKTKINKTDYDSVSEGSEIIVFYSKHFPQFNIPLNDPYKYDKYLFIVIGIVLFGFMSINEFKALIKQKHASLCRTFS